MSERSRRTSWSRPQVAQHLMHLRAQAKELDIQAQVDAWHARSPNKRLIGSGLFDVDVLGQNCFGLQVEPPPEVARHGAGAGRLRRRRRPKAHVLHAEGRTRFSTPEHVWKKKDWAEQELAFKRRVGITIGPRAKTSYVPRASSRKSVRGGEKSNVMDKLAEQVALAKASVGKTDPRTGGGWFITGPSGRRRGIVKLHVPPRAQLADDAARRLRDEAERSR